MIDINYDTSKMKSLGNNLISLSNNYVTLINALQARMRQMPTVSKEWVGPAAERFIRLVDLEMATYVELGTQITSYAEHLIQAADNIERTIM